MTKDYQCRLEVMLALGMHAALLAFLAAWQSPIGDELVRIQAGGEHWRTGAFDANPGNPPLADACAAFPAMIVAGMNSQKGLSSGSDVWRTETYEVLVGRWALIPFALLGGVVLARWSNDLFGRWAGCMLLVLYCSDPLLLSYGSLITGDTVATAAGVAASFSFWKWTQRPSISGALLCGIALGSVMLSKYVWVLMPLLWAVLWTVRRFVSPRPERWPLAGHLAVMAFLAVYVINAGYAFELTFQPWRTFQFESPTLQQFAVDPDAKSGVSAWLGAVPVPLPRNYIMGIDAVAHHVQTESYPTYVHGEFRDGNVCWFYLYGLLVKMPLGTWLLLAVAVYARVTSPERRVESPVPVVEGEGTAAKPAVAHSGEPSDKATGGEGHRTGLFDARHWFTDLVLWLPAITILVFVSWATQIRMLRYILPMLPFMFIWVGHAFVWAQAGRWGRKTLVYGALSWSVGSSMWVYPHSLSYFNDAAGGAANGHNHLIRASYDWGQDLLFLKDWAEDHPDAEPLYVACYNAFGPLRAEIETESLPAHGPKPGWYATSASVLRGAWTPQFRADPLHQVEYLKAFLDETPVDRVAYSIFIYHLDCDEANAMRAELGLELIECGE